jgi:hypothetical protein
MIRDHHAVDRLGGMTGPPADHDTAQAILIEDVPERFRFSGQVRDRLDAAAVLCGLGEAVNAVFERPFAGGDRSPQHRRKRWMQCRNLPHGAAFDEALDVGHFASVHERMDDLPVGGIPPDQENFARGHSGDCGPSGRNFILDGGGAPQNSGASLWSRPWQQRRVSRQRDGPETTLRLRMGCIKAL